MAKKELKLEIDIGETLDDTLTHFANVLPDPKKLKINLNIGAKSIKISDSTIPNKIEIDLSEELKGYIYRVLNMIEDHLEDRDGYTKEINELKKN